MNLADGTMITSLHRRHRAVEFKRFLTKIDDDVPDDLEIHLTRDNCGTHKHPIIKAWLEKHPRVTLHFTPTYSSNAPTTAASKPSKPTSGNGSLPGTKPQTVRVDQNRRPDPRLTRSTYPTNRKSRTLGSQPVAAGGGRGEARSALWPLPLLPRSGRPRGGVSW